MDRFVEVRETEYSHILRLNLFTDNVQKEEIDVIVDHITLTIKNALPDLNQFSGIITLKVKHCDIVNTTAKMMENNVTVHRVDVE